ncbi:hypothetical protein PoB_004844900 [Plakobranchus ocellatus]|uniref:Uncharacterized protein n=1 Tax=Plakobranchus ocellatus TaxID=259542 RepID=A0AAV4BUA4_9GAST|nr:hypothetical protein PoB_004844900 [Plakobranchus ocellatus]
MLVWGLKERNQRWATGLVGDCSRDQRATNHNRPSNRVSENNGRISVLQVPNERNAAPCLPTHRSSMAASRATTDRDRKLGRMVLLLSAIQLTSFTPTIVWTCFTYIWPEYKGMDR